MINEAKIKQILDKELKPEKLGENFEEINENAIKLFQKLFVENLGFDLVKGQFGEIGELISTDKWNKVADAKEAYIIAEKENFRILYVILNKLTRYRERGAISSLKREKWAIKGEYICIFYAKSSSIWHMVCPHYTEGRTIVRRYILGNGENHHTISKNLTFMDASLTEPLFERVQAAFKVQVITEDFYKRYKEIFDKIKNFVLNQEVEITQAKKFAHLLLNRLMFIYFIQKKGWINDDKNFVITFLTHYRNSGESNYFYNNWLCILFFEAMSKPISEKNIRSFNENVNNLLNNIPFLNGGLFEKYEVDLIGISLSDELLFNVIEDFLEEYNFTITEESPYDLDIAIDPAMLGKIYESLIAEEERGKSGIFYTPRIEVDLMCRLSIYEYLTQNHQNSLKIKYQEKIIKFIFIPIEEWNFEEKKEYEFLRENLNRVRIVDPACGSGAFLVGILQILLELYLKLGVRIDYNLKEDIIYNTLYGVDVKDWAIRMAEFRLWLALIESEEHLPNKRPILPNFSFKLLIGDSIVQKVHNKVINFKKYRGKMSSVFHDEIQRIQMLKKEFFEGKKDILEEIKAEQINLIVSEFNNKIKTLKNQMKKITQKTLDNKITDKSKQLAKDIKEDIKKNKLITEILQSDEIKNVFIWDLSFPEIMIRGGFDIIIANPPYIRQEDIINPELDNEILELINSEKIKEYKTQYKTDLINYVYHTFDFDVGKMCDFYVYFFFKAIELMNETGVVVFISSNSWLDVKFGKFLQEGLLRFTCLDKIIDNFMKRTFLDAEINTIISVLKNKRNKDFLYGKTKFLTFKKPYEDILNLNIIIEALTPVTLKNVNKILLEGNSLYLDTSEEFRRVVIPEKSLWNLGVGEKIDIQKGLLEENDKKSIKAEGKYKEAKWGKFLKAPDLYFKILKKYNQKFIALGDPEFAEVRRGFTTGANEFFYIGKPNKKNKYFNSKFNSKEGSLLLYMKNKKDYKKFEDFLKSQEDCFKIEKEYWMHIDNRKYEKNVTEIFEFVYIDEGKNIWVPNYLIKSPKEMKKIVVKPRDLKFICFMVNKPKRNLSEGVLRFINWGENMGYHNRPTCRSRKLWYNLGEYIDDKILCGMILNDRFLFAYNKYDVLLDHAVYGITLKKYPKIFCVIFNSSLLPLFMELEGRTTYGGGALGLMIYEYERLPVLKVEEIEKLDVKDKDFLMNFIDKRENMTLDSIFSDFNASNPEEFKLNNVRIDKREIDKIIFEKILNLNEQDQIELYKSIIKLVKMRLEKAKSV